MAVPAAQATNRKKNRQHVAAPAVQATNRKKSRRHAAAPAVQATNNDGHRISVRKFLSHTISGRNF